MMLGEFVRKLRRLNPQLRVYNTGSVAISGVYLLSHGELEHVCGVDRDDPQEHVSYNADGSIRRGGWRRVLKVLIQKGLIDRWAAERLFNTHLAYRKAQRPMQRQKTVGTVGGYNG